MKFWDIHAIFVIGKLEKIKQDFLAYRSILAGGLICIFSFEDIEQRTGTQKISNIGSTGLTRINFANISNTPTFIDILKYCQQILSQLTKIITRRRKKKPSKNQLHNTLLMTILALCEKNLTFPKNLRSWKQLLVLWVCFHTKR